MTDSDSRRRLKIDSNNPKHGLDSCPHCSKKLSSWEQVLLKVDGVLICKNCWYRIFLTLVENGRIKTQDNH